MKIIFISGLSGTKSIENLSFGIENNQDRYEILRKNQMKNIYYTIGKEMGTTHDEIEIFHLRWQDLINNDSEELNFLNKTKVFTYWLKKDFVVKSLKSKNRAIIRIILTSGAVMLTWYLFILLGFLGINLELIQEFFEKFIPREWLVRVYTLLFTLLTFIVGRSSHLVRLNCNTKRYLTDEKLRLSLRKRFLDEISDQLDSNEEFIILAHSFGTIISIDCISNLEFFRGRSFRFITLGSPVNFLSMRSDIIRENLEKFKEILEDDETKMKWIFYYSESDWLSPDIPAEIKERGAKEKFISYDLGGEEDFLERLTGKPHMKYFYNKKVIESVIIPEEVIN